MEFNSRIDLSEVSDKIQKIKTESEKVLIGQEKMLDLILIAILSNGHVLIEGVPGVAKTLSSKLIAKMIDATFKRIQFTPDLMPSDVLGTSVFNLKSSEFEFKKGPVFADILLIDEINRAPAKTQASLFEVMEERQVTNDGVKYSMEKVFSILATQNPIEQEGTYRLPEGQLDRFLFKINVGYPKLSEEVEILKSRYNNADLNSLEQIEAVLSKDDILKLRSLTRDVIVQENLFEYITNLISETRNSPLLYLGASPRASLDLMMASRSYAAIQGRDFITPDDIQFLFEAVVAHRIILSSEAELEGLTDQEVCQRIMQKVEVPK
ncbi:MAG: MoxR family ATPase [Bacteroidota bacterium]